jgi:putative membrane protein
MKQIIRNLGFAVALAWTLTACNSEKKENDEPKNNPDMNEAAKDTNDKRFDKPTEADAKFVTDVADINYAEIKLGELAQSKGVSADVKELGKMMVTDHTKANSDLMAMAQKKGMSFPEGPSNDAISDYNSINDLKGKDFDKKYCSKMVSGHKDAIDKFEKAATDCNDADIKTWAANMLPALHMHLDHSQKCEEMVKNMKY